MRPLNLHRKPILWCALAVGVVAGVAFAVWPREPVYEGKPLSYWLDQLPTLVVSPSGQTGMGNLQYVQYSNRPRPAEAPSLFESGSGPPSVNNLQFFPYLNDLQQSPLIFRPATHSSGNQALVGFMSPPRPQSPAKIETWQISFDPQKSRALFAVVALGEKCLPTLLRRMQASDRDNAISRWVRTVRQWATKQHLIRAGSVRLPAHVRRGQAAFAIVKLKDAAKPILPRVVRLAKFNRDPDIRASALDVLRCLSPTDYAQITGQTNVVSALMQEFPTK